MRKGLRGEEYAGKFLVKFDKSFKIFIKILKKF
jgi:hypothetical protein